MRNSRFRQVGIYTKKNFRLFINEKGWKTFIFAAIISLAVSFVLSSEMFQYNMATWQGFITLISACIWIGIFNSIQSICKQRGIIKREHRTGLHMSSFVFSHLIYQAVICLVEALLLLLISMIFLKYPHKSLIGSIHAEYFITYFLTIYAADVLALAISSIVKSPTTAMTIMPFLLIFELIFSGALFQLDGPAGYLSYLTTCRYGLNAACISADYNDLEDTEKARIGNYMYSAVKENNLPVSREQIDQLLDENYETEEVKDYRYTTGNLLLQWFFLILHTGITAAVSIVALEFIDKDKR